MINRLVVLFALVLVLRSIVAAQTSSELSFDGSWVLNKKESTNESFSQGLVFEISTTDKQVKILMRNGGNSDIGARTLVLYSDERGETNMETLPNSAQLVPVTSKTVLKSGKLIRKYRIEYPKSSGIVRVTESYFVNKDGRLLVQLESMGEFAMSLEAKGYSRVGETLSDVNRGSESNRITKLVFNRKK